MKRLLPLLLLILLTGCVDVEVRTRIHGDGSGRQLWVFSSTALFAGEVRKGVEEQFGFSKRKAKVTEAFREGDFILTVELPFESAAELKDRFHSTQFEARGIFRRTYTYIETWSREPESREMPMRLTVTVEMPGEITDSNAHLVEGEAVSWKLNAKDFSQKVKLRVQSRQWNLPAVLGVAALLAATGVLALLKVRRRTARCGACGAPIPVPSAFCGSCGERLN